MCKLSIEEVKGMVKNIDLESHYFTIGTPVFLKDRKDVCAVLKIAQISDEDNGICLVWLNRAGSVKYKELRRFRCPRDIVKIDAVDKVGDDIVTDISCGSLFHESFRTPISELEL